MKQKLLYMFLSLLIPMLVNAETDYTSDIDGFTYYYNTENQKAFVRTLPSGNVVIPSKFEYGGKNYTVVGISNEAAQFHTGITNVYLPSTIKSIGWRAFNGCTNLVSINIPQSVKLEGQSFSGCTSLKTITIPNGVTYEDGTFGGSDFSRCTGLTSVIIDSEKIVRGLFSNCSSLVSITLGNHVKTIEESAFSGCTSLERFSIPERITAIGNNAFEGCSGLTSITIPNSVTTIGGSAFSHCSGLTTVTIPSSVTSIGDWAFYSCSGLTSVTIPNSVTNIGKGAFGECQALESITIEGSPSLGPRAFENSGISKLILPDIKAWLSIEGVRELLAKRSLYIYSNENSEIKELIIPEGVKSIPSWAFMNCTGITSVIFPNSLESIGFQSFKGCSKIESITFGNGLKTIGSNAFDDCIEFKKVIIPDIASWCEIDHSYNPISIAHHIYYNETEEITELHIPDGVKTIGKFAFEYCYGLKSVYLPNSVDSIGEGAFLN